MRAFDLIIFDFDGTLADSAAGIGACMHAAFDACGLEAPAIAQVRARIGLTLEESIRQLTLARGGWVDVTTVARRYRELHGSVAAPLVSLFPGVDVVLDAARAAGIRLAVISQKARAGLRQLLMEQTIDRHFDLVLGSDDVTAPKPEAALYDRHVAPRFPGVIRGRVLVVGDTVTDLEFARNIGAISCWAQYGYGDAARCSALHPHYRISAPDDLLTVCGILQPPWM